LDIAIDPKVDLGRSLRTPHADATAVGLADAAS
jgi:hypothetical protein